MIKQHNLISSITVALSSILLCILCLAVPQSARALESPPPIQNKGYELVKNWDFSDNIKDIWALRREFYTRYASNNGTLDHLNDEWQVYRDNNNHVFSDGILHLVARAPKGKLEPGKIESGMIRSRWEGTYGYFEAKIKVPKGRGFWSAFWGANTHWPPEIDVVEIVNNKEPGTLGSCHGIHGDYAGETTFSKLDRHRVYYPGFDYAKDFHVFAVEWTHDRVKHYVDNVLVKEQKMEWRHNNGQPASPMPAVVNLAVGGNWPGAPTSLQDFPSSLDIAYIRVWQKPEDIKPVAE